MGCLDGLARLLLGVLLLIIAAGILASCVPGGAATGYDLLRLTPL